MNTPYDYLTTEKLITNGHFNQEELFTLCVNIQKHEARRIIAEYELDQFYRNRNKINLN